MNDKSVEIAKINDEYRKNIQGYMLSRGVSALPDLATIISTVRDFNEFSEDNDPYGEHDFGSFVCSGQKLFWKIDYYDSKLESWADPLSRECRRVLTILLADEY